LAPLPSHQHLHFSVHIPLQVKDVMAHLYFKAKESFAQQAPKEVRGCCAELGGLHIRG